MSCIRTGGVFLFIALCIQTAAQTSTPTFEVASIKPATPLGPLGMRADRSSDPGMYACRNCPIFWILSEAYDLHSYDYVVPDWLHTARFDFNAKVPAGTTKEVLRVMLQNLLADRFQLQVHREKRAMQIYEMTVGKGGPKFHESAANEPEQPHTERRPLQRDSEGFPVLVRGVSMAAISNHAGIRSDRQDMAWFAHMLAGQLQGPVIDATGLKGNYDFIVLWAFDEHGTPAASDAAPSLLEPYRPALIHAVQSQLGLKLDEKKGQGDVLVVDHIEKAPTAN